MQFGIVITRRWETHSLHRSQRWWPFLPEPYASAGWMLRTIVLLTGCTYALAAQTQTTAYDRGPNGLEAWTDDHHTKQFRKNTEPFGIIITRNGKRIRYIGRNDGGPFFWNLMLLPDGTRIAYGHGPFHFVMTCTLMDIATGKKLEEVSCLSQEEIAAGPEWVKQLLDKDRKSTASQTRRIRGRSEP